VIALDLPTVAFVVVVGGGLAWCLYELYLGGRR
jgi:hypothetical protein